MNRSTATSLSDERLQQNTEQGSASAARPASAGPLVDQVREALCSSGYGALTSVEVSVDSGHVTLRGPVRSFYEKQVATSLVLPLAGVQQLSNDLAVTR